ncbi:hypothetical protein [Streptomyces sp. NPDC051636]|uniref:hypothetical protein n=1 Tax=Streptomyces sp. NPDC051636 TaxID=3365663 RepID=UPI0037A47F20
MRTAIRTDDAERLTALTLRRVATEPDVATMSLCRHVRNKQELVAPMAGAAFGEGPPPRPGGSRREQLERSARTSGRWTASIPGRPGP